MKKQSRRAALEPLRRYQKAAETNEDVAVTVVYLMKKLPSKNGGIDFHRALKNAIDALTEDEAIMVFVMAAMTLPSLLRSKPKSRASDRT